MRRSALFILIACTSFTLGVIVSAAWRFIRSSHSPAASTPATVTRQPGYASVLASEEFDLPAEISFERVYDGCDGCGDRKLVFQRAASKRFEEAITTETDLHSKVERQGKLNPYYFNNLLRLIEDQGFFEMNNQYAMGWVDAATVRVTVRVGDRHKTIVAGNEGDVPLQLWGIYYAIEGAAAKVKWQTGLEDPQSNKSLRRTHH